jgi:aminoglycoside phosphotransferase (APT) family kinase protein
VATWRIVEVDGLACSVGVRIDGYPIEDNERFTPAFAAGLGQLLFDLHRLAAERFGPLVDADSSLCGAAETLQAGIVARWHLARIWPFDDADLSSHPVASVAPGLLGQLDGLRASIMEASDGPAGPVHSDLHPEHLLRDDLGSLAGVLDFGDAFIGAPAWDAALLHWYYGSENTRGVSANYDGTTEFHERGRYLAVAVGLYKLAKNPTDQSMPERIRRVLESLG